MKRGLNYKMKTKKRAEVSLSFLVGMILLIGGFVIVLFLYLLLDTTGMVDREVCHQSVIYKATLPSIAEAKEYIPLNCKTKKVCITDNIIKKGECAEFEGAVFDTVRVSGSKEDKEEKIKKFIAEEMAECWGVMGLGKLQIFSRDFILDKGVGKKCVTCTRIAFDDDLKNDIGEINGLGKYMMTHKVPGNEISYWKFITSGLDFYGYDPVKDVYSMEEKSVIFMELGKSTAPGWVVGVAGGVGGGIAGAKIGAVVGSVVPGAGTLSGGLTGFVGGVVVGGIAGKTAGNAIEENYIAQELEDDSASAMFFMDYDPKKISGLDCDSFENIP